MVKVFFWFVVWKLFVRVPGLVCFWGFNELKDTMIFFIDFSHAVKQMLDEPRPTPLAWKMLMRFGPPGNGLGAGYCGSQAEDNSWKGETNIPCGCRWLSLKQFGGNGSWHPTVECGCQSTICSFMARINLGPSHEEPITF